MKKEKETGKPGKSKSKRKPEIDSYAECYPG